MRGKGLFSTSSPKYFALTRSAQLHWFERVAAPKGSSAAAQGQLKLRGKMDLRAGAALQREGTKGDYAFKLVAADGAIRLVAGCEAVYNSWQDGLALCPALGAGTRPPARATAAE